ncbi:hypothetical protein AVEN_221366-1 [Araneus ventricosus]|uniref:Tesmin/TSO1-like CXC domain-containing protein n=1 Tax=Araneus ventricosus TaxID=182803 RepID=A0A4Y2AZ62_ARAVE|nr:hypothetical protein AVEN_221366-1 [Araneus ventricosus]
MWLGEVMNPLNWGWQTTKHDLAPITTIKDPASPPYSAKCAKGCRSTCSCRKSEIMCTANCANCKGHSCSYAPPETDEQKLQMREDDQDPDEVEQTGNLLTLPLNGE